MKIALLGHGNVGRGVSGIIDSGNTGFTKQLEITKILVRDASEATDERMVFNIDEALDDDIEVVVECLGGIEFPFSCISKALNMKKHVVTSNKKVMATYYDQLIALADKNDVNIIFEASVGGGIPVMSNIRHTKRVDEISAFSGIFNGTTNFILDKMYKEQKPFREVLTQAQKLGYAESDPGDDIDGHDVKYKCCLTGNMVWDTSLSLTDITVFGIRTVNQKDIDFGKRHQSTLKLIGRGSKNDRQVQIFVIPEFINDNDTLAHVGSNLNCIVFTSTNLGIASYIGQGAGTFPTAHAVVQDLVSLLNGEDLKISTDEKFAINNKEYISRFYVRTENLVYFEDYIYKKIDPDTIITEPMDLYKLKELIEKTADKNLFVAGVSL
ncbi:MAG TPA: homoserine dehydrogenase [Erysipelotrichaceae bacterium]|nr:homoserine dehydrogenase [Erysipelotrichaceae bacterium]HQB32453.1 homoserine dehydrogenase [Erysipelotrichaceae bacterium]